MVKSILQGFWCGALLALQVEENRGVERARAGTHHQPFERSEAHRGIDALPTKNRGQRAAATQMAVDDTQQGKLLPNQLSAALRTVRVADAVKTIAANALLEPAIGTRIDLRDPWHRMVIGGVEDRDLRRRSKQTFRDLDAFQVDRFM